MISRVILCEALSEAIQQANQIAASFANQDFIVCRTKLEIPPHYADQFPGQNSGFLPYFEWHAKVNHESRESLLALCARHMAHLSKNALSSDLTKRFVTIREYQSLDIFKSRVAGISEALKSGGWQISKEENEYCIFDDRVALDKGWLPL